MTIDFENESSTAISDLGYLYGVARDVVSCALDYMDCPYEAQVSVLITDDDEIHRHQSGAKSGLTARRTSCLSRWLNYETPGDFWISGGRRRGLF